MPSAADLLQAGKEMQDHAIECGERTSYIVAALHKRDKVRMRELIQALYHLGFTFKDLGAELSELSGEKGEPPGIGLEVLEAADDYPWQEQVILLLEDAKHMMGALQTLVHELSTVGYKLQSRRHLTRLLFDSLMLERALKDTGIVS